MSQAHSLCELTVHSVVCGEVLLRQSRCCGQFCGSCWNNASLIPSSLCCWPRFCIICCQRKRCELHYCTNLDYIMTKGKPGAPFACQPLSISACLRPHAPSPLHRHQLPPPPTDHTTPHSILVKRVTMIIESNIKNWMLSGSCVTIFIATRSLVS